MQNRNLIQLSELVAQLTDKLVCKRAIVAADVIINIERLHKVSIYYIFVFVSVYCRHSQALMAFENLNLHHIRHENSLRII